MKYQLQIWENNPILRAISEEVSVINSEIQSFGEDLLQLMYKRDGVGLAAPQVWKNIRMIAVTKRKKNKIVKEMIMINPKILDRSKETTLDEEACLSLPDMSGDVRRNQTIIVEYQDLKWHTHKRKFTHLDARVIQHEIDHLDGVLFIDKLV